MKAESEAKPTVGFKERYESDPEFRRQVDYGRRLQEHKSGRKQLADALAATRDRKKLY